MYILWLGNLSHLNHIANFLLSISLQHKTQDTVYVWPSPDMSESQRRVEKKLVYRGYGLI